MGENRLLHKFETVSAAAGGGNQEDAQKNLREKADREGVERADNAESAEVTGNLTSLIGGGETPSFPDLVEREIQNLKNDPEWKFLPKEMEGRMIAQAKSVAKESFKKFQEISDSYSLLGLVLDLQMRDSKSGNGKKQFRVIANHVAGRKNDPPPVIYEIDIQKEEYQQKTYNLTRISQKQQNTSTLKRVSQDNKKRVRTIQDIQPTPILNRTSQEKKDTPKATLKRVPEDSDNSIEGIDAISRGNPKEAAAWLLRHVEEGNVEDSLKALQTKLGESHPDLFGGFDIARDTLFLDEGSFLSELLRGEDENAAKTIPLDEVRDRLEKLVE